ADVWIDLPPHVGLAQRTRQKPRERDSLERHARARDRDDVERQGPPVRREGQEAEDDSLRSDRAHACADTTGREQLEGRQDEQHEQRVGEAAHQNPSNASKSASPARTPAPARRCGTRASRTRAMHDSTMPISIAITNIAASATPVSTQAWP